MSVYSHVSVMPKEVMELLAPQPGDIAVDGTTGLGGHSIAIGSAIGMDGTLLCLDRDPEALALAEANLAPLPCHKFFINKRFEDLPQALRECGLSSINRMLLDLGVSSLQLDKPERGFSFMRDGPLDMRMNQQTGLSAADIINSWSPEDLAILFKKYGEERFSRRIAKRIAEKRQDMPINTTGELSLVVASAVPGRGKTHPATRIFQALRMEVNDELGTLSRGLAAAGRALAPGGRLAVLTFHSLEDRLVKITFKKWRELGAVNLVNSKAVSCSREEAVENRRSRSAKLRVVEKL